MRKMVLVLLFLCAAGVNAVPALGVTVTAQTVNGAESGLPNPISSVSGPIYNSRLRPVSEGSSFWVYEVPMLYCGQTKCYDGLQPAAYIYLEPESIAVGSTVPYVYIDGQQFTDTDGNYIIHGLNFVQTTTVNYNMPVTGSEAWLSDVSPFESPVNTRLDTATDCPVIPGVTETLSSGAVYDGPIVNDDALADTTDATVSGGSFSNLAALYDAFGIIDSLDPGTRQYVLNKLKELAAEAGYTGELTTETIAPLLVKAITDANAENFEDVPSDDPLLTKLPGDKEWKFTPDDPMPSQDAPTAIHETKETPRETVVLPETRAGWMSRYQAAEQGRIQMLSDPHRDARLAPRPPLSPVDPYRARRFAPK